MTPLGALSFRVQKKERKERERERKEERGEKREDRREKREEKSRAGRVEGSRPGHGKMLGNLIV